MTAFLRALTTPLLPADYLALVNPLWSARELRGRVVAVIPETTDSASLVIKPGRRFRFDFAPGQYVGVGVRVEGRWRWRSYSLTCPPLSEDRTITVTVKAMPEGFLSGHLVNGVPPGTVVRLAAPQGDFVMPDPPPQSVLLLTAGSGITPVMSMLRTLARRGQLDGRDIVHVHSAPTQTDVMFGGELERLAREHGGYRLTVRATRTQGRLDLAGLHEVVPDWRERQTWVCGPAAMLRDAETLWGRNGVADRLHREQFAAARTSAAQHGGTVTFAASGRSHVADGATSVLEAGESAGVGMPFGCRMGICHTCMVTLVSGRVRDLRSGVEYEAGSSVQTCVSAPSGDCVVDI